jgi:hypothetical protein
MFFTRATKAFSPEGDPSVTVTDTAPIVADKPLSASDIFQQAIEHIGGDTENIDVSNSVDGVPLNTENKTTITEGVVTENKDTQATDEDLPLYVFEGKVMGKHQSIPIKTKEDLDRVIQRGEAAKHVIPEFKRLREENTQLKSRAERADVFDNMVANAPREFLDILSESIDETALAEFVYDKFQTFQKFSKMSEEEIARERKITQADKLLREREKLQNESLAQQKRNEEQSIQLDYKKLVNWRDAASSKYKTKLDPTLHAWFDGQMKNVIMSYRSTLKDGQSADVQKLQRQLDETIAPLLNMMPKKNLDKQVHESLKTKSDTATRELQNLGRSQAGSKQTDNKPMSSQSIWEALKSAANDGSLKIKS